MKVVILAGGLGTRLSEETKTCPKPMVEIGGKPILWHIMSHYSRYGFNEFVVALGYRSEVIKDYFLNFETRNRDVTVDLGRGRVETHGSDVPPWRVNLVETGMHTQTGGRVKRLRDWIGDETFMLTYGDGVADVDLLALHQFHREHGRLATVTAVHPPSRFGSLRLAGDEVVAFKEKPQSSEGWINGGFFVLEPQVLDLIAGDRTPFEEEPMERLSTMGELMAFRHEGFWHPMDMMRDKQLLDELWNSGQAPWRREPTCLTFGVAA
ncbi:MAG: glucose-1-phosphate cytidylyltransferase [Fimbriimonas sp.]